MPSCVVRSALVATPALHACDASKRRPAASNAGHAPSSHLARPHVQFGQVTGPGFNSRASFIEEPPTSLSNPRVAVGPVIFNETDGAETWAFTALSCNWNTTTIEGHGPRFIWGNVTLWAAPTFADGAPLIAAALAEVDGPTDVHYCFDPLFPPDQCMSPQALAVYQNDRGFGPNASIAATPTTSPLLRSPGAADRDRGDSTSGAQILILSLVGAITGVALVGAPPLPHLL